MARWQLAPPLPLWAYPFGYVGVAQGDNTQNALLAVFNPSLSNLTWGNYYGGNDDETGYSLRTDGNQVYLGAPPPAQTYPLAIAWCKTAWPVISSGCSARFNAASGQFKSATYLGTPALDQAFLIRSSQVWTLLYLWPIRWCYAHYQWQIQSIRLLSICAEI
ncbi:MAG: hypothetical protein U5L96_04695 [Owenweeksia sp.]|nr:hypothetical protein [Owenweeksia sp.]